MGIDALSRRPPDRTTGKRCPGNGVDLIGLRRENTLGICFKAFAAIPGVSLWRAILTAVIASREKVTLTFTGPRPVLAEPVQVPGVKSASPANAEPTVSARRVTKSAFISRQAPV